MPQNPEQGDSKDLNKNYNNPENPAPADSPDTFGEQYKMNVDKMQGVVPTVDLSPTKQLGEDYDGLLDHSFADEYTNILADEQHGGIGGFLSTGLKGLGSILYNAGAGVLESAPKLGAMLYEVAETDWGADQDWLGFQNYFNNVQSNDIFEFFDSADAYMSDLLDTGSNYIDYTDGRSWWKDPAYMTNKLFQFNESAVRFAASSIVLEGLISKVPAVFSAASKLDDLGNIITKVGSQTDETLGILNQFAKTASLGQKIKGTGLAFVSRLGEGYMEADDTYNSVRQDIFEKTGDAGTANSAAQDAAVTTWMLNMPLALLDLWQMKTLFGVTGEVGDTFAKKKLKDLLLEAGSESLEENYQLAASDLASKYALKSFEDGWTMPKEIGWNMMKNFTTSEGWESMVGGFVGGLTMGGINAYFHNKNVSKMKEQFDKLSTTLASSDYIKQVSKLRDSALASKDYETTRFLNQKMLIQSALPHFIYGRGEKFLEEVLAVTKDGAGSSPFDTNAWVKPDGTKMSRQEVANEIHTTAKQLMNIYNGVNTAYKKNSTGFKAEVYSLISNKSINDASISKLQEQLTRELGTLNTSEQLVLKSALLEAYNKQLESYTADTPVVKSAKKRIERTIARLEKDIAELGKIDNAPEADLVKALQAATLSKKVEDLIEDNAVSSDRLKELLSKENIDKDISSIEANKKSFAKKMAEKVASKKKEETTKKNADEAAQAATNITNQAAEQTPEEELIPTAQEEGTESYTQEGGLALFDEEYDQQTEETEPIIEVNSVDILSEKEEEALRKTADTTIITAADTEADQNTELNDSYTNDSRRDQYTNQELESTVTPVIEDENVAAISIASFVETSMLKAIAKDGTGRVTINDAGDFVINDATLLAGIKMVNSEEFNEGATLEVFIDNTNPLYKADQSVEDNAVIGLRYKGVTVGYIASVSALKKDKTRLENALTHAINYKALAAKKGKDASELDAMAAAQAGVKVASGILIQADTVDAFINNTNELLKFNATKTTQVEQYRKQLSTLATKPGETIAKVEVHKQHNGVYQYNKAVTRNLTDALGKAVDRLYVAVTPDKAQSGQNDIDIAQKKGPWKQPQLIPGSPYYLHKDKNGERLIPVKMSNVTKEDANKVMLLLDRWFELANQGDTQYHKSEEIKRIQAELESLVNVRFITLRDADYLKEKDNYFIVNRSGVHIKNTMNGKSAWAHHPFDTTKGLTSVYPVDRTNPQREVLRNLITAKFPPINLNKLSEADYTSSLVNDNKVTTNIITIRDSHGNVVTPIFNNTVYIGLGKRTTSPIKEEMLGVPAVTSPIDEKADIERRRKEELKSNDIIIEDRGNNYYSLVETKGSVISFKERDSLIGKKVNFILKNPNNNKFIDNYKGIIIKHESAGITGDLRINLTLDNGQKFSIDRNGYFYTQSNVRFTEEIPNIVTEINAKYDAEVAALEQKEITKEQEKVVELTPAQVVPAEYSDDVEELGDYFSASLSALTTVHEESVSEEEESEFRRMLPEVPLSIVDGLILIDRGLAEGLFNSYTGVTLSRAGKKGVAFHEALHAAMWLYLPSWKRNLLYKEAKKKYGDVEQLEERMAEDFREQANKGLIDASPKGTLAKFFRDIWNIIQSFISNKGMMDSFYQDIYSGSFNYKYRKQKIKIEALSQVEQNKLDKFYESLSELSTVEEAVAAAGFDKNRAAIIYEKGAFLAAAIMQKYIRMNPKASFTDVKNVLLTVLEKQISPKSPSVAKLLPLFKSKGSFSLMARAINLLSSYYKIEVSESDFTITDVFKKDYDKPSFYVNPLEQVSAEIKMFLGTLIDVESNPAFDPSKPRTDSTGDNCPYIDKIDTDLGVKLPMNYKSYFNSLLDNVANIYNYNDMLNTLRYLGNREPFYHKIADSLQSSSPEMRSKFFHALNFTKNVMMKMYKEGDEFRPSFINRDVISVTLKDKWEGQYRLRMQSLRTKEEKAAFVKTQNDKLKQIASLFNKINKDDAADTKINHGLEILPEVARLTAEVAHSLGLVAEKDGKDYISKVVQYNLNKEYVVAHFGTADNPVKAAYNSVFEKKLYRILKDVESNKDPFAYVEGAGEGGSYGYILALADIVSPHFPDLMETTTRDVHNQLVWTLAVPAFINQFTSMFNRAHGDKAAVETELVAERELFLQRVFGLSSDNSTADPKFTLSNLFKKMFTVTDGVITINKEIAQNFRAITEAGLSDYTQPQGMQYTEQTPILRKATKYGAVKEGFFAIPTPSDAPTSYFLKMPKTGIVEKDFSIEEGKITLSKNSPLYQELLNIYKQELAIISAEQALVFGATLNPSNGEPTFDKDGQVVLNPAIAKNKEQALSDVAHFRQKDDKMVFFDDGGKVIGKAFQFHFFTGLNSSALFNKRGLLAPNALSAQESADLIDEAIQKAVNDIYAGEMNSIGSTKEKETLESFIGKLTPVKVLEYGLNTAINNFDMINVLYGGHALHKNKEDFNKRAKEVVSPTKRIDTSLIPGASQTKILVVKDVEIPAKDIRSLVKRTFMGASEEKIYAVETFLKSLIGKSSKEIKEALSNTTEDNKLGYKILAPYLRINKADGQAYMTIDRWLEWMVGLGEATPRVKELAAKAKVSTLTNAEAIELGGFPIEKPFYYGPVWNAVTKKYEMKQLKMSLAVLIPQMIKGTELEAINTMMNVKGIKELHMESTNKVNRKYLPNMYENGEANLAAFSDSYTTTINSNYYGRQLIVPEHHKDSENTQGTQWNLHAVSNLPADMVVDIDGKRYTSAELIQHYDDLLSANVTDSAFNLFAELGLKFDSRGSLISIDTAKFASKIQQQMLTQEVNSNYIEALEVDGRTKDFKLLPGASAPGDKIEQMLYAMFTKKVNRQKMPGITLVQFSNLFLEGGITDKMTLTQALKHTDGTYIDWLNSKARTKTLDAPKVITNADGTTVTKMQILAPAFSKKFFTKDGKQIKIDQLPEELRTLIGYRLPTETKHSAFVFEIVGFLPQSMGSTIVTPDDIIPQSGADFDIDKLYLVHRNFRKTENGYEVIKYDESTLPANLEEYINQERDKYNRVVKLVKQSKVETVAELLEGIIRGNGPFENMSDENLEELEEFITPLVEEYLPEGVESLLTSKLQEIIEATKNLNIQTLLDDTAVDARFEYMRNFSDTITPEMMMSKKQRQNRLIDIWETILRAPETQLEQVTGSSFDTLKTLADKYRDTSDKTEVIAYGHVQDELRKRAVVGRDSKGIFANANRFTIIAQLNKLEVVKHKALKLKFSLQVIKEEGVAKLKTKYGVSNVKVSENNVIVTMPFLGYSNDGTFTDRLGVDNVTNNMSQALANALDIIKDPTFDFLNINNTTINAFIGMIMQGATLEDTVTLLKQPIIQDLVNETNANEGFEDTFNPAMKDVKQRYLLDYIAVHMLMNEYKAKGLSPKYEEVKDKIKTMLPKAAAALAEINSASIEEKNEVIKSISPTLSTRVFSGSSKEMDMEVLEKYSRKFPASVSLKRYSTFLKDQLFALTNFVNAQDVAREMNTVSSIMKTDTNGPGPRSATNRMLEIKEEGYKKKYPIIIQRRGEEAESALAVLKDSQTTGYLNAGKRFSQSIATKVASRLFIHTQPFVQDLVTMLVEGFGSARVTEEDIVYVERVARIYAMASWDFFSDVVNFSTATNPNDRRKEIMMGVEGKPSFAERIEILKQKYPKLNDRHSLLYHLVPMLKPEDVARNGGLKLVKFNTFSKDTMLENFLIKDFKAGLDSSNVEIRELYRDAVKYAFLTNGFSYGASSYSRLIPLSFLKREGLNTHLKNTSPAHENVLMYFIRQGIEYTSFAKQMSKMPEEQVLKLVTGEAPGGIVINPATQPSLAKAAVLTYKKPTGEFVKFVRSDILGKQIEGANENLYYYIRVKSVGLGKKFYEVIANSQQSIVLPIQTKVRLPMMSEGAPSAPANVYEQYEEEVPTVEQAVTLSKPVPANTVLSKEPVSLTIRQEPQQIYSQLGNKTQSENVVIDEVNGRKPAVESNVINKNVKFEEEQTTGYRNRTIKNASADATIALAVDFTTAGEKLTKSSVNNQNKKYIPIDANNLEVTQERVNKIVSELNSVNAKTLNIAGNGIYTMKQYTQKQIDDFTYELLKAVVDRYNLPKVEEFNGFWTRKEVAEQTDKVFLFGDNTNDRLNTKYVPSSTQAVIRGLPNSIGIDTKKDRGTNDSSYFTDADFVQFKQQVDEAIQKAKDSGKTIVLPADGIGTGKAMLKEKAPKLFEYLQNQLSSLKSSVKLNNKIESIRTGGQTGFDEAGAKAGVKLGIPTTILAPKGWTFRNLQGQDISDEQQFKARFENITQSSKPIVAYRTRGNNFLEALEKDNAIGNPWGPYGMYKTAEDGTAVKEFIAWMIGEKHTDKLQDYRQAIIDKISEMKGKPILYYKDLGRPSHATALDYLINKYNWDGTSTQSIEISSNTKGIGGALTNPTELARQKGNIISSYPIDYNGVTYIDVEQAYQKLKDTSEANTKPIRENSKNYKLMVALIKAKLEQHTRLITEINKMGGSSWLLAATHQPTKKNTVWETGGKNWFISALNDAYMEVAQVQKLKSSTQNVETSSSAVPVQDIGLTEVDMSDAEFTTEEYTQDTSGSDEVYTVTSLELLDEDLDALLNPSSEDKNTNDEIEDQCNGN